MVILAVSQKWPVLLYGPAGAGKSALINKLAAESGNQGNFLFVCMCNSCYALHFTNSCLLKYFQLCHLYIYFLNRTLWIQM